jgi:4-hydroxyphenylpyruvate dioxygenase
LLTSIATVSISGTLEGKLRVAAAAGYDGVEIFENDLLSFPGSVAEVGAMMRDLGLACTLFQPFRDFEGMPSELRGRVFDRAERKFDVMQELGTGLMLVCSNVSPASSGDPDRIAADFRELGERAGRRGLRIGYEALAWGRHVHDHREAWNIVRKADHPAVGLILDSFHSLARRIPVESLGAIDPARIFIVQLADAPWLEMDYLSWSRHFRNMPGQGDLPVVDFVRKLIEIGYAGPLSLEIFNDRFRAGSASTVALDGLRSLRVTADEAARSAGSTLRPAMPPRVTCSGVEFIEFAVSEEEAASLGALLRSLGFAEAGRHRSKAVTRWRQGGINLVVNCETEGFAHSHNIVHGPSVCALCLRVDDVGRAAERAEALSINSFEGRVGRGEMKIPAVRGVGGSLIYLIREGSQEEVWERDFIPIEPNGKGQEGAGLLRVDHIAQTMSDEEFLSWLLYYCALLDVAKKPLVEVADPLGLVQTQPVESADRALRIVLTGSASPHTLSARLLERYWGAGVQYLSFATDDIFATAERLAALGLEQLPIPRNYYDDIEVRFELEPALIERMAARGILYDSDESGEYFQLYSRAFDKRFFFEIVERRGYDGYGAANDPIRLAAQSRFKDEVAI